MSRVGFLIFAAFTAAWLLSWFSLVGWRINRGFVALAWIVAILLAIALLFPAAPCAPPSR